MKSMHQLMLVASSRPERNEGRIEKHLHHCDLALQAVRTLHVICLLETSLRAKPKSVICIKHQ